MRSQERFGGLAENCPGPNAEQYPVWTDEGQLDRDGSDIDPQSMGHNRLAVPASRPRWLEKAG